MQKQAVLVCSVCALAAILTIAITMTLLKRGKNPAAPVEQPSSEVLVPGEEDISDHYQISETSAALLPETADAGESYQKETLFLGDSNTVRLYANGLISLQQFCAKEGIGTHAALNEGIVTFKKDSSTYTIAQAVAKMKPRRVVIMLGTNDTGMSVDEFISSYTALVQAIQESYPYTDIIVNTVPPVPANHANYPNMDQTRIDDFNMALLSMCEQMGLKFLNSAEALKDANGYGREDYYQTGDIHLKPVGLKAMLSYLRTHAYQTDDRRPDTANIPTRAEYTPNPSSAVTAPSSSEAAGSSEEQGVLYQASYRVDKTGGTLSSGSDSGKTSLSYEVTSAAQSISVTAVPQDGYVFVKWSDGVTQKTRTDTNFKQNVDVTATIMDALGELGTPQKASDFGFPTYDTSEMQGISLLPVMRGETDTVRDCAIAGYYGMSWSLITEDYSYVHWLVSEDVKDSVDCIAGSGTEMKEEMWTCTAGAKVQVPDHDELYDRKADPFQLNNIADQNPDKAREMLQQLKLVIGEIRTS